jgi:2-polyprenyl-6-hydroxyphenyl methylase/3-demethylubiquinone-9 3-methyltransferase
MSQHAVEVMQGKRFEFGENWERFLSTIDSRRISAAADSLELVLGKGALRARRFLDVGSGSGLMSLAARSLEANVHSFDYDPRSVACTRDLKQRYFTDDSQWVVEEGSILDPVYLARLGTFDVVYSWGVLHHTGAMWRALENVARLVAPQGRLWIAIYNDQGRASRRWRQVKHAYCKSPGVIRPLILGAAFVRLWGPTLLRDLASGKPGSSWQKYASAHERGMSPWRDAVDWVGGYPFEVARPDEIFAFYHSKGFRLISLKTCGGGIGCNEYVFEREPAR